MKRILDFIKAVKKEQAVLFAVIVVFTYLWTQFMINVVRMFTVHNE